MKINSCWIEIPFSSISESLQILSNEIGNNAMSRSGDCIKKSLKIPKGQAESSYRRRRDKTMAKRKSTKRQTAIFKILQLKLIC
jgi:hypothetical protein